MSAPQPLPRPVYSKTSVFVPAITYAPPPGDAPWYPPVIAGADTLSKIHEEGDFIAASLALMERLTPDAYTTYLMHYCREGRARFGASWMYADIVTVLLCLSRTLKPRTYLEIGVRRGRSACAVATEAPYSGMFLFDLWQTGYAGIENPGPDFVRNELVKVNHRGPVSFFDGDSHVTLPRFFAANPSACFDLITVDGDHSERGAAQDLCDVLPRLAIGGAIVFDDIAHPAHPELNNVWRELILGDERFSAWSFRDAGYGVGFAIRKY
ncbi:MAG: class I SAM-dependent methyltransferase [Rhodospirillaceae bacterium]|nr:MAG: class I SAM-dependent methyltransferase [Rhodospirillaceae bacterium]